jgi:hypothetical protein
MVKSIKKSFKYFMIFIGIIIAFPMLISIAVRIPKIQTLIVRRMTSHFSEKLNSTISVGTFEYRFFNKLIMNDVLIKDLNNDTLIYSQNISAGIKNINLKDKSITLGKISIINPVVKLITDSSGTMNLMWYIDFLKTPDDTTAKRKSSVRINEIDISNARFSMINMAAEKKNNGIDFNNLHLSGINGLMEDLVTRNDSTSFRIYNLGFRDSGGFTVRKLNSDVTISKNSILLSTFFLTSDSSILNLQRLGLHGDSSASFKNFIRDVRLDILMDRSLISIYDLRYFVPSVNGMNEKVWLSGRVFGTVADMRGRNVELSYGEYSVLDCDFDLSGLPEIDNSFIHIGVNKLTTNAMDFEKINLPEKGILILPGIIYKMGTISFNGSFTGFTTDFVTYGKLTTDMGMISTDISLRPEESNKFRVKGLVTGNNIALGELTGESDILGNLSMRVDVDGYAIPHKKFSGSLTGKIDSVEINRYKYRNISLNGNFTENTWNGNIKIVEDNIKMDLLGMFDLSKKLPEFDFTLNLDRANLNKLNFDKSDTSSSIALLMTANFKGNSIDNLDGEIKLLNSTLRKYSQSLDLKDFSLRTFKENDIPAISLHTDFLDAELKGFYNFQGLRKVFKTTISSLMPLLFSSPSPPYSYAYSSPATNGNSLTVNNFTFIINFRNTDRINEFFRTGIFFADKSMLSGVINSDSIMTIKGSSDSLNVRSNVFKDFSIEAALIKSTLSAVIRSSSLSLFGKSELIGLFAGLNMSPNNFNFTLNWDNKQSIRNSGKFTANGVFLDNEVPGAKPVLRIEIDSTGIYSRSNLWKINRSFFILDSTSVTADSLFIRNGDRYYLVNGILSEDPADTLALKFSEIDISPLNYLTLKEDVPDQIPMALKGQLNGDVSVTNIYNNPLIVSNLKVIDFSMLQSDYGDLSIVSGWNSDRKVADIHAGNNLDGKKMIDINGYYDPLLKKINLTAVADKLPVDALNVLLKVFASGITGTASGKVNLSGSPGNLVLKGALMAENASMKIDYLQTKYKLNDSIRFSKNTISFRNIKLTDDRGNTATLSGSVFHKNFRNYSADLMIIANNFMVLNTRPKDNDMFYGTGYATGVTTIKSDAGSLSFDISARTDKNTKFYIPLNTSETVSNYSFISFVSNDSTAKTLDINPVKTSTSASSLGIDLNFDLELTPDAEVQLIFDPKVGDIMKGQGSGNLNIRYNSQGDFKISGDYIIEEGEYLFTLKNIINKPFSVENGGKILFNGNIDEAEIDLKATYKNLKASLFPILQDEKYSEKIPVECQIYLTGKLFNPNVKFDIYLPSADESTRAYLKNAITTEEELNRQVLYLLVTNNFYSEQVPGSSGASTSAATSTMAVTTAEMISNQLSNWISYISNDVNLGFVYRPGQNLNPQEVQVALSTQVLNDRLTINGNFDVRGPGAAAQNVDQLTGDFDVEYRLTDKIRLKVFNRYNDIYTGRQATYTQGLGIFFNREFNKFSDLFKRKEKPDMKKEEGPAVKKD